MTTWCCAVFNWPNSWHISKPQVFCSRHWWNDTTAVLITTLGAQYMWCRFGFNLEANYTHYLCVVIFQLCVCVCVCVCVAFDKFKVTRFCSPSCWKAAEAERLTGPCYCSTGELTLWLVQFRGSDYRAHKHLSEVCQNTVNNFSANRQHYLPGKLKEGEQGDAESRGDVEAGREVGWGREGGRKGGVPGTKSKGDRLRKRESK